METNPTPARKLLREMTTEERNAYNSARTRKYRARQRAGLTPVCTDPFRHTFGERMSIKVLLDRDAPPDVMGKKVLSFRVGVARRLRNALAFSKQHPELELPVLEGDIIALALNAYLDQLETTVNDKKPFPDPVK